MPSPQKQVHTQSFTKGMNTVVAKELLEPNQYPYMLNCNVLSSAVGDMGVVTNDKGNTLVSTPLPIGVNRVIGCVNDEEKNNFYFALWNSNNYHTWFRYNDVSNNIVKVFQNLTDTEDVSIFNWKEGELILHANVIGNGLLYWVIKGDTPRKIDIQKCLENAYGTILEVYTRAYKRTASTVPTATYFSDIDRNFNKVYGYQFKFAERFRYDNNEISHVSGFSNVALPQIEPYRGIDTIPTENNCIQVTIETGDRTVTDLEILMQQTNPEGGSLDWVSVVTLNKAKLGIGDNTFYTYNFYNDGAYIAVPPQEIINPYSYLPVDAITQDLAKNSLVYGNFSEGFETIKTDATIELAYKDLFVEPGTVSQLNNPFFGFELPTDTGVRLDAERPFTIPVTFHNGTVYQINEKSSPVRFNIHKITIGSDVKSGNNFTLTISNNAEQFNFSVLATLNDTPASIYDRVKSQLINTGRIYKEVLNLYADINNMILNGDGSVTFSYIFRAERDQDYHNGYPNVNRVNYNTLKDTGQSVATTKLGSTGKVGFVYEDVDGRKSLAFTDNSLVYSVKTINEFQKYQTVTYNIEVNHIPPVEAVRWYPVFSNDLTYNNFIQVLVQKVVETPYISGVDGEYLDLNIGSLFVYQKIHENTTLKYEFKKGDRIRLVKSIDTDVDPPTETWYDFYETEIISYKDLVETRVDGTVSVNGTTIVTVPETDDSNVGLSIRIGGVERRIVSVASSTTYTVDNTFPGSGAGGTDVVRYPSFEIINRNGVIRIKKPATPEIIKNSLIEIYSPALVFSEELQGFYDIGVRYPVLNVGTDERLHGGETNQTPTTPASISVANNNAYVRNRELPLSNVTPNTQVYISPLEDPNYSDFYVSFFTDKGRVFGADIGAGKVHFGSRLRYSSNYIEDTRINGLNYFYNASREDYNDKYGDIRRINVEEDLLYVYKDLKTGYLMLNKRIITQADGEEIVSTTTDLLSDINYFSWDGGIGNNPEAFCQNKTHRYHLSPNSGVIIRLGRDGETPISEVYYLDNKVREYIREAQKNGSRVYMEFDRFTGNLVVSFEASNNFIYVNTFDEASWQILDALPPEDTEFTVLTNPSNGSLDITIPNFPIYTPNEDFLGKDEYTYSAVIDGITVVRKVCITVLEQAPQLIWRVKASSAYCLEDEEEENTGYQGWATLEQLNLVGNVLTGVEKPNVIGDPNYVEPIYDSVACPLPITGPDPFSFTEVTEVGLDMVQESDIITLTGLSAPSLLNITSSNSSTVELFVNGLLISGLSAIVANGDTIQLYAASPNSFNQTATITSSINLFSTDWLISTVSTNSTFNYTIENGGSSPEMSSTYEVFDNTNDDNVLTLFLPFGTESGTFSVVDDANTMLVRATNDDTLIIGVRVEGDGGYNVFVNIGADDTFDFENVPKGDITITVT